MAQWNNAEDWDSELWNPDPTCPLCDYEITTLNFQHVQFSLFIQSLEEEAEHLAWHRSVMPTQPWQYARIQAGLTRYPPAIYGGYIGHTIYYSCLMHSDCLRRYALMRQHAEGGS